MKPDLPQDAKRPVSREAWEAGPSSNPITKAKTLLAEAPIIVDSSSDESSNHPDDLGGSLESFGFDSDDEEDLPVSNSPSPWHASNRGGNWDLGRPVRGKSLSPKREGENSHGSSGIPSPMEMACKDRPYDKVYGKPAPPDTICDREDRLRTSLAFFLQRETS